MAESTTPEPGRFPILLDVAVRYGDLGPDGLISTRAVTTWFEDARVGVGFPRFSRVSGGRGRFEGYRILLASQQVERLHPIRWSGKLRVGIGVRRIGRTSFSYGYAVFVEEKCLARGESVTVLADADGPAALPDELLADLADIRLDAPDAEIPRPGPERRDPSRYPFALPLRARIGDVDTNRHANNVALVSWYADAVAALHVETLGSGWGGPPPELAPTAYRVQYVAEVGYPAEYTLGLAVAGHDETTVRYELGVFAGDRCVGLADATGARGELGASALEAYRPVGA